MGEAEAQLQDQSGVPQKVCFAALSDKDCGLSIASSEAVSPRLC